MNLTRRHMIALSAASLTRPARAATPPLVFAAASLKTVLDEIAQTFPMRLNYAGSGVLARQITLGAPADVFVSANPEWMEVVAEAGFLAAPATRILSNSLVLISGTRGSIRSLSDLKDNGRIAMGFANAVPAGQYAKAAFMSLNLWEDIEKKIVQTENVRAAMALVARKELPWGVVYKTDAIADPNVHIAAEFAPETHPKIIYQAGVIKGSSASVRNLTSPAAKATFARHGFVPL